MPQNEGYYVPEIHNSTLAQVPKVLTLKEAILLSLRYNPDIQSAELQRVVDKFNLRVAQNQFELQYALSATYGEAHTRSNGDDSYTRNTTISPSVSLNGEYGTTYQVAMDNPINNINHEYNPKLSLSVVQPLIQGFGKDVTLASLYDAEDTEKTNKLGFQSTIITTVNTVTTDYRGLIQAQQDLIIQEESLESLGKSLENDKAMIKAGRKARAEIYESQASYESQRVNVESSKQSVYNAKLQLMSDIGLQLNAINFSVPNTLTTTRIKLDPQQCYKVALENNQQYVSDVIAINATRRSLLTARDQARTQLDLTLDAATGGGSGGDPNEGFRSLTNNKNTALGYGFNLTVPIDNYTLMSAVLNAKIGLQQAEIALDSEKRTLQITIENDVYNVNSAYEQLQLAQTALEVQLKNLEMYTVQQRMGLISSFQFSTNETNVTTAKQQLLSSQITYLNYLTTLYQDMGTTLQQWDINLRY